MNNFVFLVGILTNINNDFVELDVEELGSIKVFIDYNDEIIKLTIGKLTKIEGELSLKFFPFPVIKANRIYQIKSNIN